MNAYLLAALVFIITMLVFIFQNDTLVSVQFLAWKTTDISLAIVVIVAVCVGALIAFLLNTYRAFKTGQKMRKLIKENQRYEQEIKLLKGKQSGIADLKSMDNGSSDPDQGRGV